MNPRTRSRMPASIGSNQASPANSAGPSACVLVLSCSMAWSPPALQRRKWLVATNRRLRHQPISTTCPTAPRFVFDGHKPHARSLRRLADRLGIGRIVLLPLHEGLDVCGRDQPHRVAQFADLAPPVMGPATGLQGHHAPGLGCEELDQLDPRNLLSENDAPRRIRPMRLEAMLRDVQANRANLCHGRLPQVVSSTPPLWHTDA